MKYLFLFSVLLFMKQVKADSPITSTVFYIGHETNPLVAEALKTNAINLAQINFLAGDGVLPEKLAIISALGWGENAQNNFDSIQNNFMIGKDSIAQLSQDQILVLIYAQAMADYFDPFKTVPYIEKLNLNTENRESALWVLTLVTCQTFLDDHSKWCEIYQRGNAMRKDTTLIRDMKLESAEKGILSYMDIYKDTCTE